MLWRIFVTLVIGAVGGWLAGAIMNCRGGLVWNIILGVIGSMVGGFICGIIGIYSHGWVASTIISAAGACLVVFIARKFIKI
ncbi:MAG: GlsB/YeaQ/YmgE family stress response membrane protein [Oscillospiraceae bacterium]